MTKTINLNHISKIEGHAKLNIKIDKNVVKHVKLTMFEGARFFEGIVKGDKKISTNVADKIVEQLEAYGVKHIYGIPGDSNLPIIEAIRKSKKLNLF